MCACNLSTPEVEKRTADVQGHSQLNINFETKEGGMEQWREGERECS